jgi:hypothetical protein
MHLLFRLLQGRQAGHLIQLLLRWLETTFLCRNNSAFVSESYRLERQGLDRALETEEIRKCHFRSLGDIGPEGLIWRKTRPSTPMNPDNDPCG